MIRAKVMMPIARMVVSDVMVLSSSFFKHCISGAVSAHYFVIYVSPVSFDIACNVSGQCMRCEVIAQAHACLKSPCVDARIPVL